MMCYDRLALLDFSDCFRSMISVNMIVYFYNKQLESFHVYIDDNRYDVEEYRAADLFDLSNQLLKYSIFSEHPIRLSFAN